MSFDFKSRSRSSFDEESGVSIPQPRMLPASCAGSDDNIEYQYSFFLDGKDIGGLGLLGTCGFTERQGRREQLFTLDLGREGVLRSALGFRETLGNSDDEFVFLRGLAQGLVMAYAGRTDNDDDVRYVAIADADSLARAGMHIPDDVISWVEGVILLAEAYVPAHID